ncbi:MAG: dTDP-4-dehydrorhamnose 3,5-epimerase [Clostridia bacterium]|nr:dTDP-4-dehydrorhamnose 3,5-epimerase [Clostridia bacterium]
MNVIKTELEGVLILEPSVFGDNRGWFFESYNEQTYRQCGIDVTFVQDNHSYSAMKGTVRGIHFQKNPMSQAKLVRCTDGTIKDVIVDLRKNSPTYKKWIAVELSKENKRQVFIPHGFGHGFVTLTDNCELQYKVDKYYSKECDRSILWNDKEIGVDWGVGAPILSDKDKNAPSLALSDVDF